ncbi:serine/threonine-protein kinase/endoribonuclease IRE1 [Rhagoletis pomonella]|uniref:serine/threonine-protein kinase/endoribonuclease IRE1 n=1 Tax=Rhagoletis pomonella TaxID=28610 RepID=UPI00178736D6|nr:serine/threonine-protein kinase/endoribonuclease IRE1 [Rhagoletis pomonella]
MLRRKMFFRWSVVSRSWTSMSILLLQWNVAICFGLCILIASATLSTATVTPGSAKIKTTVENAQNLSKENGNNTDSREGVATEQVRVFRLREACTDLARDEETLMVFSTLGGGLTAIDPITSEIRWTIADDPPIRAEQEENVQAPQYLPDPRDGSIYQLGDMGNLKKLPYTIPQLVASAPCRSSDGILYSGKKSDTWFMVDPKSGTRKKVMGFGPGATEADAIQNPTENENKAKRGTSQSIYLGRTQYTVMMYDSLAKGKNAKPWNITFYDYSAHTMTPDISKEYEYLHLTTTSNGNIVTLDRKNGKFLWRRDLTSPVVAAFLLGAEGLLSVPFTTVSDEAFESILEESKTGNVNTVKLFQSLYVGEHRHGLYALPSLVDEDTPRISASLPIKLLDGPNSANEESNPKMIYINDVIRKNAGIVLGHYNMPTDGNLQISPSPSKEETSNGLATINHFPDVGSVDSNGYSIITGSSNEKNSAEIGVQTEPVIELKIESTNAFNKTKKVIIANSNKIQKFFNDWFMEHPSGKVHQILIVLVLAMVAMFWYMCSTMRELKNQSENGSKTYSSSNKSSGGSSNINALDLIDLGDGNIRVGKISFNSSEVLGKGCEGTFVFRGTFEERSVAVKRLLPECFTFADREVALLRESDAHENVVRYFCTEQDRQFRYIAVELCAATLQDYTEGERSKELRTQINVWEVLRQAAAGLSHLHSLHIVHRDIKPQNVLLSLPDISGTVRVMISDFGLCKKLNFGKTSFSRRSGVTGTDGWIAPEMMRGLRTTTAVDIFSLGCVYYYVLTGGHHAFGDALKRQHNILAHDYNLSKLKVDSDDDENMPEEASKFILAEQLIADMIHKDAQCRPLARCISAHPVFWNNQKILAFLQDVSDRVEKLQFHVEPLKSLEKNGRCIVRDDWNAHVDPLITEDLRKYRGYMGASVRDLLRALRNKKHHYHELTPEVQQKLGCIPHDFTNYWINKFPELISHAYHAFSICAEEPIFGHYYNADYHFSRPWYFDADDNLFQSLQYDPKPLQRQVAAGAKDGSASPKRPPRTPEKQQQLKQRKGIYNFRKTPDATEVVGVGLQRNLDLGIAAAEEEDEAGTKRDVFANFKFRRNYGKSANRIYGNFNANANANANNGGNKEKNVTWTLPGKQANDE